MTRDRVETSILQCIGHTRLVALRSVVPEGSARVLLKIEAENPTGSMKDRMALAMIEAAERDGRLAPGGQVVEYTAGSTGVSLSFVCAVKRYPLAIVTSDAFSIEKRQHMQAYGAILTVIPSDEGKMDEALTLNMIEAAQNIRDQTGGFLVNQLGNSDQLPAYHRMGEEIWQQADGEIDAFVQLTGTAASCLGISETLHRHDPEIHCVAVEPSESAVLSGRPAGAHGIEGVGAGFVVPLWDAEVVDEVATVSTDDAIRMAKRLAAEEGIFGGTSTGGNVSVALDIARRLGPGKTVVTVMCDTGMKYLSKS